MKKLSSFFMSGKDVLPLVEGGKGINASSGMSCGAWAKEGGIGTFSAVNADAYDDDGRLIPVQYFGRTRQDRHQELIAHAIKGGISQARVAHDISQGQGRIHLNVLWEMGAVEPILHGILSQVKNLVHGVTCGAGMPYRLAEICSSYEKYYYPIVSSARAFRILWKRAFHKFKDFLGGVVYEDPWLAGGHNGLSNSEDPQKPEVPFPRVLALRETMREYGLGLVPIVMAGGVWCLSEWKDWINNKDLGPIAFQFGTRPLVTQESPISIAWKHKLLTLKPGDVKLNKFSPTGFYSSAVENDFLKELYARSDRQVYFSTIKTDDCPLSLPFGQRGREVFVSVADMDKIQQWEKEGFSHMMKTPSHTLIFVDREKYDDILKDQRDCMGCLSHCVFSNFAQNESGSTGQIPDPRSFCIQKTLQDIGHHGDIDHNLMFAGHNAYRFASDPFYKNGFIPTVHQLFDHLVKNI